MALINNKANQVTPRLKRGIVYAPQKQDINVAGRWTPSRDVNIKYWEPFYNTISRDVADILTEYLKNKSYHQMKIFLAQMKEYMLYGAQKLGWSANPDNPIALREVDHGTALTQYSRWDLPMGSEIPIFRWHWAHTWVYKRQEGTNYNTWQFEGHSGDKRFATAGFMDPASILALAYMEYRTGQPTGLYISQNLSYPMSGAEGLYSPYAFIAQRATSVQTPDAMYPYPIVGPKIPIAFDPTVVSGTPPPVDVVPPVIQPPVEPPVVLPPVTPPAVPVITEPPFVQQPVSIQSDSGISVSEDLRKRFKQYATSLPLWDGSLDEDEDNEAHAFLKAGDVYIDHDFLRDGDILVKSLTPETADLLRLIVNECLHYPDLKFKVTAMLKDSTTHRYGVAFDISSDLITELTNKYNPLWNFKRETFSLFLKMFGHIPGMYLVEDDHIHIMPLSAYDQFKSELSAFPVISLSNAGALFVQGPTSHLGYPRTSDDLVNLNRGQLYDFRFLNTNLTSRRERLNVL